MQPLIAIFVLVLIVVTVIGALMALAHLITRSFVRPPAATPDKNLPYECGVVGASSQSTRVSSGFYLTAILFVLFDIEIIFLYPWAISYRDFLNGVDGGAYLLSFLIFLALFALGLFWEIRAKALRWK